MPSEAQKRATQRYQKFRCKAYTFKFNHNTDADIIQVLESVDNRQGYIKHLIRQDMKKRSQ